MSKKIIVGALAVIVAVILAVLFRPSPKEPTAPSSGVQNVPLPPEVQIPASRISDQIATGTAAAPSVPLTAPSRVKTTGPSALPPAPAPAAVSAPTALVGHTVTYTDSGFSPASITVRAGDSVTFKNDSSQPFWPASNPHPVHTGYPTTGGCIGSTFDACGPIAPGGSWSFTFGIKGAWGYHNHLNPGFDGTVVVE